MSSHTEFLVEPSRHETKTTTAMDIDAAIEDEETVDSPQPSRPAQASRITNVLSKLIESDSESAKEAPVQPRRKLISALKPQLSEASSDSEEDDNGAGAYERIKAQLMSGTSQQDTQKRSQNTTIAPQVSSSESDEEMPVRTNINRRIGARKEKSLSPRLSLSPSARSRRSSPGLFVTPNASPVKKTISKPTHSAGFDSDLSQSTHNADLDDRVKQIRAERKMKAQQSKAQEQKDRAKKASRRGAQESDSDPDGENGRKLTQQARPTRKASKKALEDISREQQRISRNMQLTHQAKTKKRYSTKDLLVTFGYQMNEETAVVAQLPTPAPSSAPVSSDAEVNQIHDTPPKSPCCGEKAFGNDDTITAPALETLQEEELDSPPRAKLDKGKGRAPEFQHLPTNPLITQVHSTTVQHTRVEPKKPASTEMVDLSDSDDDLEITKSKSRFPVFDRLPHKDQQEPPSLLHLRHLAHLTRSDNVRKPKGAQNLMSVSELQFSLAQKARQQANKEREEKLEDMRRRGIHIETEEEREKQQMEIEDMVAQFERQRQEDLQLSKLERGEAKKNGEILGDEMLSSDDDEDYVGSGEEGAAEDAEGSEEPEEESELDLSGSEEEDVDDEADDEEELHEENAQTNSNDSIGEMTNENNKEETQSVNEDENMEDETVSVPLRKRTVNRARNVIVDDEDESETDAQKPSIATQIPSATHDNVIAAFGFNNPASSLGLTQVFAGTMANLELNSQDAHQLDKEPEQNSLDFLRSLPDTQPSFSQASEMLVPNSQTLGSPQELSQAGPVSQINLEISQMMEPSPTFPQTQLSEMPEPTQDVGFGLSRSPAGLAAPVSTIDTLMMTVAESPVMKRKGRLQQRKNRDVAEDSDADEASESEADNTESLAKAGNAFAVMTKAAKKKQAMDNFNKKTSWAKDAVEEQAEESEDEYAGIGGADGEDSDEDDEELNKMIDTSDVKVDERKMAAFYA
jgi:mediator of replication checkpoint protein 1